MCSIQSCKPEIEIITLKVKHTKKKEKKNLGKICCSSDWQCLMIKNMIHPKTTHAFQSVPRALAPTKFWVPKRHFCPVTASSIGIAARQFLPLRWHRASFTAMTQSESSLTYRKVVGAKAFVEQDAAGQ